MSDQPDVVALVTQIEQLLNTPLPSRAIAPLRSCLAALKGQMEEQEHLRAELEEAREYLSRLLRHCWPNIEPLPTLLGVCTQIDNGLAVGLTDARAELERVKAECSCVWPAPPASTPEER